MRGACKKSALLILLALAGCGRPRPAATRIDPALAVLVPADTQLLAGIRMDALRKTPLYQQRLAQKKLPIIDTFPRADVSEMLIASGPSGMVTMARGKFVAKEGPRFRYKGHTFLGDEQNAVFFLIPGTALAGTANALQAILDARDRTGIPEALRAQVESIVPRSQIWITSAGMPIPAVGNLENIAGGIQDVTASVEADSGLRVQVTIGNKSDADATRTRDGLNLAVGVARLGNKKPGMARLYDSIRIEQQQRIVRVTAGVPPDLVDAALKLIP